MSKKHNGECDRLGHIVMLLFKALALGKKKKKKKFQSYKLQRLNPKLCFGGF